MTESKESKIKKCQTSHFINDYTSYIQKINQESREDLDNDDNTIFKKRITMNSSISQTKDQSHQDRFMLTSKSLSTNTVEGCYKNKIRFDIKGVPIKKLPRWFLEKILYGTGDEKIDFQFDDS